MAADGIKKTGLSFSGGGVRSTAFCSGVLRRLLQKGVSVDYLSSVSGGGYAGASYMDWKFRNGGKDDPAWHKVYFENLRKNINFLCDCSNPVRGIFDGLATLIIGLFLSIGISFLRAFSFVTPTTLIVDYFWGGVLNDQFDCGNATQSDMNGLDELTSRTCRPIFGPGTNKFMVLIIQMFGAFVFSFFMSSLFKHRTLQYLFTFAYRLLGFCFAMVFLPWFLEIYRHFSNPWTSYLLLGFVLILWLFFPSLREKAFIALVILLYAYCVKWTVFRTPIAGVEYSELLFWKVIIIGGVLLWFHPFLAALQMYGIKSYVEWRHVKSFFSPESKMAAWSSCCNTKVKPVYMAELADTKPEYQCNVTVSEWYKTKAQEKDFEVLTFSPRNIERIDRDKEDLEFGQEGFIQPKDIRLGTVMTTSASALAYDKGDYLDASKSFREIEVLLGLGYENNLVAQIGLTNTWMAWIVTFFFQLFFGAVVITIPVLVYFDVLQDWFFWEKIALIVFVILFVILSLIAIMPTGNSSKGCYDKFVRWCNINIVHVRVLRHLFDIAHTGKTPPPIVTLGDGGHTENLGLLSLFKLRLPRIVVVNGGNSETYATDLLSTLQQAREKLRCSFTGVTGRDINEDIRDNLLEKEQGEQPRGYRFKVQYYEKDVFEKKMVGEGEVLMLVPRHPNDGLRQFQDNKWSEFDGEIKLDLDESIWGPGPALKPSEVDRLTGCILECCHSKLCNCILNPLKDDFPLHSTVNQVFTRSQFAAYHREGYHACLETEADRFLDSTAQSTPVITQPTSSGTPKTTQVEVL